MKVITICSSAQFYEHTNQVAEQLETAGYKAIVPLTARQMKERGDYDVSYYKTWYDDPANFDKKKQYVDGHIAEVEKADAILVVNDEKKGIPGYIGFNVMMEMAIAYYLKKPIFVLNDVTKDNPAYEEVMGMGCHLLGGDIQRVTLK